MIISELNKNKQIFTMNSSATLTEQHPQQKRNKSIKSQFLFSKLWYETQVSILLPVCVAGWSVEKSTFFLLDCLPC